MHPHIDVTETAFSVYGPDDEPAAWQGHGCDWRIETPDGPATVRLSNGRLQARCGNTGCDAATTTAWTA